MPRFPRRACTGTASVACLLLLVAAVLGPALPAGGQVRWRSSEPRLLPRLTPAGVARAIGAMVEPGARRHVVVQFSRPIDRTLRGRLEAGGVELLAYLGDNGFFAAVDGRRLDVGAVGRVDTLKLAQAIDPSVKLHPMLLRGDLPPWSVVGRTTMEQTPEPGPVVALYVLFHPDVALAEATELVEAHGAVVRASLQTVNGLVIEMPSAGIATMRST